MIQYVPEVLTFTKNRVVPDVFMPSEGQDLYLLIESATGKVFVRYQGMLVSGSVPDPTPPTGWIFVKVRNEFGMKITPAITRYEVQDEHGSSYLEAQGVPVS